MEKVNLRDEIYRIINAHNADKDGGYALVLELKQFVNNLDENSIENVIEILMEIIDNRNIHWGIALELIRMSNLKKAGKYLIQYLQYAKNYGDFEFEVLKTLLRIRYKESLRFGKEYIKKYPPPENWDSITIVALLVFVSKKEFLKNASKLWVTLLENSEWENDLNNITSMFLLNIHKVNHSLIIELHKRIWSISHDAGKKFKELIKNFYSSSRIKDTLSSEEINKVLEKLK